MDQFARSPPILVILDWNMPGFAAMELIRRARAGRTFSRDQLLSHVWGKDRDVDARTVDANVRRLRKILADPCYEDSIQTVRGFGYRFAVP